jgi:hypothetical protein
MLFRKKVLPLHRKLLRIYDIQINANGSGTPMDGGSQCQNSSIASVEGKNNPKPFALTSFFRTFAPSKTL